MNELWWTTTLVLVNSFRTMIDTRLDNYRPMHRNEAVWHGSGHPWSQRLLHLQAHARQTQSLCHLEAIGCNWQEVSQPNCSAQNPAVPPRISSFCYISPVLQQESALLPNSRLKIIIFGILFLLVEDCRHHLIICFSIQLLLGWYVVFSDKTWQKPLLSIVW